MKVGKNETFNYRGLKMAEFYFELCHAILQPVPMSVTVTGKCHHCLNQVFGTTPSAG